MSKPPSHHAILASHGTDDPIGARLIHELVIAVAAALPEVQIHETFVDVQQPQVAEVLGKAVQAGLKADPDAQFTVVPLLLGTGYHVKKDMADAVAEVQESQHRPESSQAQPEFGQPSIALVRAFQSAPEVLNLLVARILKLAPTKNDIVIFTTAGSSDEASREQATATFHGFKIALGRKIPGVRVELAYLSAADPRLKDLVPKLKFQNPRARIFLATHLLAPGYFLELAKRSGAHQVADPLLAPNEPPAQELVQLVIRRIAEGNSADGRLGCVTPNGDDWSCSAGCNAPCRA